MRRAILLCCAVYVVGWPVYAAEVCGDFNNTTGPWDYRNQRQSLKLVEDNHFDANVENLKCCKAGPLGADIDFTLRAYPNHHRALVAMEKLSAKLGGVERVPHANFTVACYYERAVRFRPDDGTARMLYANYLAKKGKPSEAIKHMEYVEQNLGANANLHYNMGLVYLDLKQYDKALFHAHKAYQLGFTLPGLRNRLQRAGKWREPAAQETTLGQSGTAAPVAAGAGGEASGRATASEPAQSREPRGEAADHVVVPR